MHQPSRSFTILPGQLALGTLQAVYKQAAQLCVHELAWPSVDAAAATVRQVVASGKTVYGVNTGFGLLAKTSIPAASLASLQVNLLRSHQAGVGADLDAGVVRLILLLKAASLARGYSGVRRELIELVLALANHEVYPCIPAQGSVGASGDLAPLAHLGAALIGEGEVLWSGRRMASTEALAALGLQPLVLEPKEGLALINGTQVSTALALAGLFRLEACLGASLLAGALSVDAMKGSDAPFDSRIHALRGHVGQELVAAALRRLLFGSEIRESHRSCDRVQDPYSLRCQPQVLGACADLIVAATQTLEIEANGVSDNPLVFASDGAILSGGNFHAEPVAFAADQLALAAAEIGSIAERRIALLVDPNMSNLPAFLVKDSGLNSGFMIAQVTAAALVAENRTLANPASTDSIPTSANQEDHVSMATHGARRLLAMTENLAAIVAIEMIAAAQGIEFHRPAKTSVVLEDCLARIRARVPVYGADRAHSADIKAIQSMILAGDFADIAPQVLGN